MDIEKIKKELLNDKYFIKELSKKMNDDSFINKLLKKTSDENVQCQKN